MQFNAMLDSIGCINVEFDGFATDAVFLRGNVVDVARRHVEPRHATVDRCFKLARIRQDLVIEIVGPDAQGG